MILKPLFKTGFKECLKFIIASKEELFLFHQNKSHRIKTHLSYYLLSQIDFALLIRSIHWW